MKNSARRILTVLAIVVMFCFTACGEEAHQTSSKQINSEPVTVQQQVEQWCGSDAAQFGTDSFIFHSGNNTAALYDIANDEVSQYIFYCGHRSGIYKIELYCENNPDTDRHLAVRLVDGEITEVIPFECSDMFMEFGLYDTVRETFDEKVSVGSMYCQHTGCTLNIDFLTGTVTAEKVEIPYNFAGCEHLATREGGGFSIYRKQTDEYVWEYQLVNNTTGEIMPLGTDLTASTGFLPGGSVYAMNMENYRVFTTEGLESFSLAENFPLGILEDGTQRILCGIMKNEVNNTYVIVYFDVVSGEYVQGTTLLEDTYKLSVLDARGYEIKTYETGKYAETHKNLFAEVSVRAVNEHTVCFFEKGVTNSVGYEVFVDLDTEKVNIMDYRQW